MINKDFLSTAEVAQILGVSRVTIFKKIKEGKIKATRIGRNFAIAKNDLGELISTGLQNSDKEEIEKAVSKTVTEYGETLKLLGRE
jgi:excisionase family DNA binding protein